MKLLKFTGDISLDQAFDQNKDVIYDNVLEKIQESYQDETVDEVKVITIEINNVEYSINLARVKFVSSLENAIAHYEKIELYEKCQVCLDIIREIKSKNK